MTTIKLDLTPEEEKEVEEVLTRKGQTLKEFLMSVVYLTQKDVNGFPELVEPKTKPLIMKSDGNGAFVFPDDTPEHVKELLKYAE